MRRGEIYMADLGDPIGHEQALRRPVLLANAQPWLESRPPVVMVLPLTRTHRPSPTHVEIEPGSSGLKEISYVKCEDLRAISPLRLERRFGSVKDTVMWRIDVILRRLLSL
ncbi:mRNA interferase MazF [Nocardiopsis sp. Huas11]|uniref:type II toxin-antitoxin system PemK/MazF family toxin n=1 Tax=Nocardiopsis sp. Huas11 TaxID=2183912 RepID=UPI000EB47AF8|nr:type II toxin-antitoxin system PemK/MazF family toxin [Nocardiopsis sp. Huas11]RKS10520.1 mRNA interferase MazF [Nocardiopsis sp. Huas11]